MSERRCWAARQRSGPWSPQAGPGAPHDAHSGPKPFPTPPARLKYTLASLSTPREHSITDANQRVKCDRDVKGTEITFEVGRNGPPDGKGRKSSARAHVRHRGGAGRAQPAETGRAAGKG